MPLHIIHLKTFVSRPGNRSFLFTAALLISLSSCHSSKIIAQKNPMPAIFIQEGHRGCRGLMPENTIPAMIHALSFPVVALELDVVISKDKQVVVSHEAWFNHEISTKPDGGYITEEQEKAYNIYQMDYADVKKFDVGMKPHPRFTKQQKLPAYKPLLAELIDSVQAAMMTRRRPMPWYNIEIKSLPETDGIFHPGPEEFADLVMNILEEKGLEERVVIQSFDIRPLQVIHRKYPDYNTALLIDENDKRSLQEQLDQLGFIPYIYSPHYSIATRQRINECHAKGMRVIPWTVNEAAMIGELEENGADGVITDYPDLFK